MLRLVSHIIMDKNLLIYVTIILMFTVVSAVDDDLETGGKQDKFRTRRLNLIWEEAVKVSLGCIVCCILNSNRHVI